MGIDSSFIFFEKFTQLKKKTATLIKNVAKIFAMLDDVNAKLFMHEMDINQMNLNLAALVDQVTRTKGVEQSAVVAFTALQGSVSTLNATLATMVAQNAIDSQQALKLQTQIDDLSATLSQGTDALGKAIANDPDSAAPTGPTGATASDSPTGATADESATGPTSDNSVTGPTGNDSVTGPTVDNSVTAPTVSDTPTGPTVSDTPTGPTATDNTVTGPTSDSSADNTVTGPTVVETVTGPTLIDPTDGPTVVDSVTGPVTVVPDDSATGPTSDSFTGPTDSSTGPSAEPLTFT